MDKTCNLPGCEGSTKPCWHKKVVLATVILAVLALVIFLAKIM